MGRSLQEVLVTPAGGGKGRPLLVFLHGYGAAPSDVLSPAFTSALRRLGDRAPVVLLPEGDVGWWHDRIEGPWGSYVLERRFRPRSRAVGLTESASRSAASRWAASARSTSGASSGAFLRDRRPFAGRLPSALGLVRVRQPGRLRAPRPDQARPHPVALRRAGLDRRGRPRRPPAGSGDPRPRARSRRRRRQLPRLAGKPRRPLLGRPLRRVPSLLRRRLRLISLRSGGTRRSALWPPKPNEFETACGRRPRAPRSGCSRGRTRDPDSS